MAVHLLLPAAGIGRRFGGSQVKQYCLIAGKPLIEWTLQQWQTDLINGQRLVIVHPEDQLIDVVLEHYPEFVTVIGGERRVDSVISGLNQLNARAEDWVLVHDVARPCVRREDIARLLDQCQQSGIGGLLATPLTDTIKHARQAKVRTLDRSELWAAQTPQCFRFGQLKEALSGALAAHQDITDEASAMEWFGQSVQLVAGSRDNFKLTHPEDLPLISAVLAAQGRL